MEGSQSRGHRSGLEALRTHAGQAHPAGQSRPRRRQGGRAERAARAPAARRQNRAAAIAARSALATQIGRRPLPQPLGAAVSNNPAATRMRATWICGGALTLLLGAQVLGAQVLGAQVLGAQASAQQAGDTLENSLIRDPALLAPQPEPNCAFKPEDHPNATELQRLDYERQCYRQLEMIVRNRLQMLQ